MHLIGLRDMSREQMTQLLDTAEKYLDDDGGVVTPEDCQQALAGNTLGLLFLEPSTRTRVSFEMATRKLGGEVVLVTQHGTSVQKGESATDICRTLAAMGVDGFIVRHHDRQLPHVLVDRLQVPIINAGNGSGEHPTQGLLDALTLRRHFDTGPDLSGLKVAIMGDVVHSRVARSDAHAFSTLGAEVLLAGPPKLLPSDDRKVDWPANETSSRKEALQWADAVVVLRIHGERIHGNIIDPHEYAMDWGIDSSIVERYLSDDAVILHPGPVIRGVELSDPVVDGDRCLILDQAANGVAMRQAVLEAFIDDGE